MAYPYRTSRKRKAKSSESNGRKSKTWMSERTKVVGGLDVSPHIGLAWWKSPMMKAERFRRAALRR